MALIKHNSLSVRFCLPHLGCKIDKKEQIFSKNAGDELRYDDVILK